MMCCDMMREDQKRRLRQIILFVAMAASVFFARRVAAQAVAGDNFAHDPSTMIKDGNRFYVFYTGQGIQSKWSTDMFNWNTGSEVFPGNPPSWTTNAVNNFTGVFWAPDIAYFNGRYNLYYACSEWGTIDSAIGLVTSPSLQTPTWTDQGKVIQSDAIGQTDSNTDLTAYNTIDPSILMDTNGTIWMSFGSYSDGILVMQLDPATGKRVTGPGSVIHKVADNGTTFFSNTTEGSCLYQRGGYYYLFLNFGGCCSGVDSTYNIRVGRSTNVFGPFRDKNNVNMTNGGGTMLLESTGRYIGPGHAAIFNDNGTNWFTFHYYDGNNSGISKLGIMQLSWTPDDWPALTNDWCAFYPFEADAREDLGQYNGQLRAGALVTNEPARSKVLNLDGVTNYVTFPLSVANASTFAGWVKWRGGGAWQRIFDFGSGTGQYFFLTPSNGVTGRMRFAIKPSGGSETIIDAPAPLPIGSWCHVAVVLDGIRGKLYLNGYPVATNNNVTVRPWQVLAKTNYVGDSQFTADPSFNGQIDSFRIYGRALTDADVLQVAEAHPSLAHRYSFTTDARDSIGTAHGTLNGNALVANDALVLDGTAGTFVRLPGGLVSGASAVTLEFWVSFGVNGNWARVYDFGSTNGVNGRNYLFYSPHTGNGTHQLVMSTGSGTRTEDVPGTLDGQSSLHIVCIVDPANGYTAIYTNGVLESEVNGTLPALSSVSSATSYIGRSLFSADAWLNANIDEFRIYHGRLTPAEIAADAANSPDALAMPLSLAASDSSSGLALTWPSYTVGYGLESSPSLGADAVWSPVAGTPAILNGSLQMTLPKTNGAGFYRLRR